MTLPLGNFDIFSGLSLGIGSAIKVGFDLDFVGEPLCTIASSFLLDFSVVFLTVTLSFCFGLLLDSTWDSFSCFSLTIGKRETGSLYFM